MLPTKLLPIEKYRPAAAEVLELVGRVLGSAKIDQVEIGVLEIGAGQVRAAEVRLADFLRRAVGLLVEFVGVKPRAAALSLAMVLPTSPLRLEPKWNVH